MPFSSPRALAARTAPAPGTWPSEVGSPSASARGENGSRARNVPFEVGFQFLDRVQACLRAGEFARRRTVRGFGARQRLARGRDAFVGCFADVLRGCPTRFRL